MWRQEIDARNISSSVVRGYRTVVLEVALLSDVLSDGIDDGLLFLLLSQPSQMGFCGDADVSSPLEELSEQISDFIVSESHEASTLAVEGMVTIKKLATFTARP